MERDPRFLRSREPDVDTVLIRIVGVVLLLLAAAFLASWFHSGSGLSQASRRAQEWSARTTLEAKRQSVVFKSSENQERISKLAFETQQMALEAAVNHGIGSSIDGRAIHECEYRGHSYLQLKPCESPWVERSGPGPSSRRERVAEQELIRQLSEAKLQRELTRLAAATPALRAQSYSSNSAAEPKRARCERAKAYRDEIYRRVDNNRDFDLIRRLNDQVYEACKDV